MAGRSVALQLSKPPGFKYLSGQYVYINIPKLGWMEWHPFTLTSAPHDDFLGLQIRAAGDWTGALYDFVEEAIQSQQRTDGKSADLEAQEGISEFEFPTIHVDGPYGAPTQEWQNYSSVVMIGAGIGVTPCASVLRDVLNSINTTGLRGRSSSMDLRRCQSRRAGGHECATTKVHFFWCTRDKDEAGWFREELEAISKIDVDGLLDINIHITSVDNQQSLSNLLKICQMSCHAAHGEDVMTGLRTNFITKFGRPDWEKVLTSVAAECDSKVGVFYCGPPTLASVLQKQCQSLNRGNTLPVKLDFYQERF